MRTSTAEALSRLDMVGAVRDHRRFNYVCKVTLTGPVIHCVPFTLLYHRTASVWYDECYGVCPWSRCFDVVNWPPGIRKCIWFVKVQFQCSLKVFFWGRSDRKQTSEKLRFIGSKMSSLSRRCCCCSCGKVKWKQTDWQTYKQADG